MLGTLIIGGTQIWKRQKWSPPFQTIPHQPFPTCIQGKLFILSFVPHSSIHLP